MDKELKKEILDILDNVYYWETCPQEYNDRIDKIKTLLDQQIDNNPLTCDSRQRLFNYFSQEHDILLLDSDFSEIQSFLNTPNKPEEKKEEQCHTCKGTGRTYPSLSSSVCNICNGKGTIQPQEETKECDCKEIHRYYTREGKNYCHGCDKLSKHQDHIQEQLEIKINFIIYDWDNPKQKPDKYGKYWVRRKDGKLHTETWNRSGWAYNHNSITHWAEMNLPF